MSVLRDLLRRLGAADVRFIVVGGVAVVLHGHLRATKDLDLVIDLAPDAARKALQVMLDAGLRPTVPVNAFDFADAEIRRTWIEEKNMRVFQMCDPKDARRNVDLFVEAPIDFEEMWARSVQIMVDDVAIRVAAVETPGGTWPDARDDLAHVLATTTPAQRLEWLDDLLDLAHAAGALEKARRLEKLQRDGDRPR